MSKRSKYSLIIQSNINFCFVTLLVVIIAFSNFTDCALILDGELEKIENFTDGENENKEQEKLEKSEKDVLLSMSTYMNWDESITTPHKNQEFPKIYNLYLSIPTPPPDLV